MWHATTALILLSFVVSRQLPVFGTAKGKIANLTILVVVKNVEIGRHVLAVLLREVSEFYAITPPLLRFNQRANPSETETEKQTRNA